MLKYLLSSVASFPGYPGVMFAGENGAGAGSSGAAGEGNPPAASGGAQEGDGGAAGGEGSGGAQEGDGEGASGEDGASGEEGEGEGEGAPAAAAPPAQDWRDRELSRKHRQIQEEKRRREQLEQELADARALLERAGGEGAPPAAGTTTVPATRTAPDNIDQLVDQRFAARDYNAQCDATFHAGKAAFKDKWEGALSQLEKLGGLGDGATGVQVMTGILATDDPAKVLFTLGNDPDEYHRVMDLPPAKRQTEFVKIGMKPAEPAAKPPVKRPSDTPPPRGGIERRAAVVDGASKLYDPNTKDEDWYAIRAAQKKANWEKKHPGQRLA